MNFFQELNSLAKALSAAEAAKEIQTKVFCHFFSDIMRLMI